MGKVVDFPKLKNPGCTISFLPDGRCRLRANITVNFDVMALVSAMGFIKVNVKVETIVYQNDRF